MMRKKNIYIFRGIGIGFILAASLFFAYDQLMPETKAEVLTDDEIVERAHELGMEKLTRLDDAYLTDEQVIEKAKSLGMDFVEKDE